MSLLSSSDIAAVTGFYVEFFDTFKQPITVFKEPIRTPVSLSSVDLWKFGDTSNESNYNYTPVSGMFYAIVDPNLNPKDVFLSDIEQKAQSEYQQIQVQQDFVDFIENGVKNQSILIRDQEFELMSDKIHDPLLTFDMYQYKLKLIK